MKKLSIFFIRSFVGPFLATFFISMFMLVMQFLWKYIDDLMGKGLEISIIVELLFYVSASLLPLALPLAILLSSLIVMGNLGESNELTALKSSGLSIYRILRPLTGVVILIAVGTFYFIGIPSVVCLNQYIHRTKNSFELKSSFVNNLVPVSDIPHCVCH